MKRISNDVPEANVKATINKLLVQIEEYKQVIADFRAYDEERKKHCKALEFEHGILLSEIDELKDQLAEATGDENSSQYDRLVKKIANQKAAIRGLLANVRVLSHKADYEDVMRLPAAELMVEVETLRRKVTNLEENLEIQRKANKRIVDELIKYKRACGEYE